MRTLHVVSTFAIVLGLAAGCKGSDPNAPADTFPESAVRDAAEHDFDCFRDEITLTPAGSEQYLAKGCGKEGRYAVKCSPQGSRGGSHCTANAIEEESSDEDPPAEAEEGE